MWTPRKILYTFVGAIVLTVMFPVLAVPMSTPVLGVEVIADDELDQYSGSGSVILPSAISASSRQRAASCVGCRWKVTLPCRRDDDHQDAGCRGVILGCPQGREVKRAWVARTRTRLRASRAFLSHRWRGGFGRGGDVCDSGDIPTPDTGLASDLRTTPRSSRGNSCALP